MEQDCSDPMESMDTSQSPPSQPLDCTTPPMHSTLAVNDDGEPVLLSYKPLHSPYCHQISMEEYREQASSYTQQALKELQASPEYRRHMERCHSCGVSWFDDLWTQGCTECGQAAMTRVCPICKGVCGSVWRRDVKMSHSFHQAYWDGCCGHKEAAEKLTQFLLVNDITDEMEALHTH